MKEKLLLVDDEEGIRKVLGITLSDMGYEIFTAENGEKALEIFDEHNPAIVLSDIKMPGMGGLELLKRIKKSNPDTEVIIISGHGDMDLAIQSLKYEAADFIVKPISGDALEVALKRVHERISMRRQLKNYTENLERLVEEKSERLIEIERLATQRHQKLAERYQQLFDQVPCYVSVHDINFKLTAINRRFKEDFGDKVGSNCYEVCKHRTEPCYDCPVMRTFEDGQSHYSEGVVTSKTGEHYNVLIWTSPIYDDAGEVTQVIEMSTNVTQVRKLQSHLSSLGLLIGSTSHAIKGLLTGLDGGMYLVNSGFAKENEQQIRDGWETVKVVVERIRKMVLDILHYARGRELKWEGVSALSFAEEIAVVFRSRLKDCGIEFVGEFDESLRTVEIDAGIVHPALLNILENAMHACVQDKAKPEHRIVFGIKDAEDAILFTVEDNGAGMDKETMEKLFAMSFSSKGQQGTGLGLFISNQIIRQHGGSITVESKEGAGSRFTIKIEKSIPSDGDAPADESV